MTFFCEECKYIEECKPHKDNPQSIGCCDFGLFDEEGMINEEVRRGRTKKKICGICGIEYDDNGEADEDGVCNNCITDILNFIDEYREDEEE